MATLFIADLHLQSKEPAITAGFLRLLQTQARSADALYILGDFFESWIGDDDVSALHQEIASALRALTAAGVPCYFIHGNRDFLLGQRFADACGMTLLAEETVINVHGRQILIMHGDTLCRDDTAYQAFRARVHTRWIQTLFLALPLFLRRRIAARMRANSQAANHSKPDTIMDVTPQAVVEMMEKYQIQWLIHGHTHRPAIHPLSANGQPAYRVVLGAWHDQGSVVRVSQDNVELLPFPFSDAR
ncbi:UDP-2,3-diacylglucosamine diphosphatase [Enterobacteriaceae bacterium ESL0689]|nr:UDP-2,3-diacylglucosamine diphosphatase [Enterobacteriaceae bacterium ESL0689]